MSLFAKNSLALALLLSLALPTVKATESHEHGSLDTVNAISDENLEPRENTAEASAEDTAKSEVEAEESEAETVDEKDSTIGSNTEENNTINHEDEHHSIDVPTHVEEDAKIEDSTEEDSSQDVVSDSMEHSSEDAKDVDAKDVEATVEDSEGSMGDEAEIETDDDSDKADTAKSDEESQVENGGKSEEKHIDEHKTSASDDFMAALNEMINMEIPEIQSNTESTSSKD